MRSFPALAIALAVPVAAGAHLGQLAAADHGPEKIHKVEKIAEGVYCIQGRGGNVGLVVGASGAILIDDQFANISNSLLAAVRSVTDRPLRWVVNTHYHPDHVGGNAPLEKQVWAIVAHANVRKRLAEGQAREPGQKGGLPSVTFGEEDPAARARLELHLDDVEIELLHYQAGHTDGDVVVVIPAVHAVHLGDLFFNGRTPVMDLGAGGSLAGMIANVERILAWVPDDAKIIPGHGPVGGKKELARFLDFLVASRDHVAANPGRSGAELAASFDRKAFPEFTDIPPFLDWAGFFELASGRRPKGWPPPTR